MHDVLKFVGPARNSDGQEVVNHYHHRKVLEGNTNAHARAMLQLLKGWEDYAKAHQIRYEDGIGTDGVLGEYWAEVGLAIKRLLDGETGGLDCGSISANITAAITAQGFETDGYNLVEKED